MHTGAELEQAQPHLRQGGTGQLGAVQQQTAKKHQQVVGHRVELETKGIGAVNGAGQAISRQVVFQFLNVVLGLATLVVSGPALNVTKTPI